MTSKKPTQFIIRLFDDLVDSASPSGITLTFDGDQWDFADHKEAARWVAENLPYAAGMYFHGTTVFEEVANDN